MDRGSMAGGPRRPAWSGRAKPRPLVVRKQVATKAARKSAPGPMAMTSSQSEDQGTQEEEERSEDGIKVVVRKSAPGPRAMIMTSSQTEDQESQEQEQDLEVEEEDEEGEEEEEDSQEEKFEHSEEDSEERSEDEEGKEESPEEEVRVHVGAQFEAARRRALAPIECEEHRFSDPEFLEEEVVCSLRLKLQRFLEAGTSFVDEIKGMQGRRVTHAVVKVGKNMVSKSLQHSERLVKALLALQLKRGTRRKRKRVVAVQIAPREPVKAAEVETVADKRPRLDS